MLSKKFLLKAFAYLAILSTSSSVVYGAPTSTSGKVLTAPNIIPSVFSLAGLAELATPFTYTFYLPSQNDAGLESWLENNSQTASEVLTIDQLQQYAAPTSETLTAVKNFLSSNGFQSSQISYNVFQNRVTVQSTVGQAAKLFSAQFSNYNLPGGTVQRTKEYTIPAEIADAVDFISPFTSFIEVRKVDNNLKLKEEKREIGQLVQQEENQLLDKRAAPASCSTSGVTPTCLRQLYGTYNYVPTPKSGVTDVFIAGFINQNFAQSDLTGFLQKYRPDAASAQIPVINAGGAYNVNFFLADGDEAMLDTETVAAATYPLKSTFYDYGTELTQGDIFEQAFQDILANYKSYGNPGVYSISYGADESSVSSQEGQALCKTAAQLTALGTTIVVASGDNGVGGSQGDTCPPFVPTYPSTCQYLLSVGATQSFSPEVAVNPNLAGFYSGAGFSNIFPRPSYQNSAVSAYLAKSKTPTSDFNVSGRAYPDVSAQGSLYDIQYMGMGATVSGTSCSTPTFASVIALINDARRKAGKSNVGWVNPLLYKNPSSLTDITSGQSLGCSGASSAGFQTATGWDPSTGLGTPIFSKLLTVFGV